MESNSNKWFRNKWNRLKDLERIERESWEKLDDIMVDEIGDRMLRFEKKLWKKK